MSDADQPPPEAPVPPEPAPPASPPSETWERIREYTALVFSALALVISALGYGHSRSESHRKTQIELNATLARARDLLAGENWAPLLLSPTTDPNDLEHARHLLQDVALVMDPQSSDAHRYLGAYWRARRNPDQELQALERALALDPTSPEAHLALGQFFARQLRSKEALAASRRAIDLDPSSAAAQDLLGTAFYRLGQWAAAIAAHRKALEIDPGFALAHRNLARVLLEQGDLKAATAAYRRALDLEPEDAITHSTLGSVLLIQGDLEAAIVSYRRALELDPHHAITRYFLGEALLRKGDKAGAREALRKLFYLDPDFILNNGRLFPIYLPNGSDRNALTDLTTECTESLLYGHTNGCNPQGILPAAISSYRRALELEPADLFARDNLELTLELQAALKASVSPSDESK